MECSWNEGLRNSQMAQNYHLDPAHPVRGEGRVPVLTVPALFSDANKIAWMRAFLGWAYRCVVSKDPKGR